MYAYIKGELEEKSNGFIVIENNGIGYKIFMSNTAIGRLGELHSEVKVYTYYQVREDNISLYGFNTKEELRMFELLISVSGVGSKSAINMLSNIEASSFAVAVVSNDIKKISSIKGIGNKTAQRLVLELKDKLKAEQELTKMEEAKEVESEEEISSDAVDALQILGYTRKDIEVVLKKLDTTNLSTEEIIKQALKYLS
ncbi:MAG: Holliday junction branch migration protein RuvA [Clostridia bacterium]|nr:Holliday junction branch migration protein RuvA [Clostridia bacterium]